MIATLQEIKADERMFAAVSAGDGLVVRESMAIRADSQRILSALTIGEYMEAWLHLPETPEFRCSMESDAPGNVHFELSLPERLPVSIQAQCRMSASNRLFYKWIKVEGGSRNESTVEVRLEALSGQCTLYLSHSGLSSLHEYQWHLALWKRSLNDLRNLMEPLALRSTRNG